MRGLPVCGGNEGVGEGEGERRAKRKREDVRDLLQMLQCQTWEEPSGTSGMQQIWGPR